MAHEERLVTDFASLRVGDLVVVYCDHPGCGRKHRGMLLEWVANGMGMQPDGSVRTSAGGWLLRQVRCSPSPGWTGDFCISAVTVARRIVFKVDTGLSRDTSETTARPKTKEEVR